MKVLVSILALAFTSGAFAIDENTCPDLTGTYTCNFDGQLEQREVKQENKNGVVTYDISGNVLTANGVAEKLPDDEQLRDGTIMATCGFGATEGLNVEITGKVYDGGQFFGDLIYKINFKLDAQKNMVQTESGSVKSTQGEIPLDGVYNCTRN